MKWTLIYIVLTIGMLSCTQQRPSDFELYGGGSINLDAKAYALMFLAPDCPLCQTYSTEFVKLSKTASIPFYGVFTGDLYTDQERKHFIDSFAFDLPILKDYDWAFAKSLDARTTPEFFIMSTSGAVMYRGRFDNWATNLAAKRTKPTEFYFADALQAFEHHEEIQIKETEPLGCVIEFD